MSVITLAAAEPGRPCPMPGGWRAGVPAAAMAAAAGGACPVHRVRLVPSAVRVPGGAAWPAGWCAACEAWWHRPYPPSEPGGLAVTWDQR
jgi:hypothetical protein